MVETKVELPKEDRLTGDGRRFPSEFASSLMRELANTRRNLTLPLGTMTSS